ncbi:MAG: signal recognition particle-docking protein FtsY [Clostridia bacterium]|nr:signal recognition particle-docking protein FtsY [Clostridia bacterium]
MLDFLKRKKNKPTVNEEQTEEQLHQAELKQEFVVDPIEDSEALVEEADESIHKAPIESVITDVSEGAIAENAGDYAEVDQTPSEAVPDKKGLFSKLKSGLTKTRNNIFGGLFVESDERLNDEFYDELEEAMIISDMGMATTEKVLTKFRAQLKQDGIYKRSDARMVLIDLLAEQMRPESDFVPDSAPSVILIVGVNGVGKTTSIGKIASMYKRDGRNVLLAAGDTFRAAAAEQLTVWSERAGVPIIKHNEGADPAAVLFDAISAYKARKCDMLICDTAGRLHNKKNLMNELAKMRRVIERELPDVNIEVLLVLDATTGQNAIAQAKVFGENTGLTGIILTKLDGTAKGGVVVAVNDELHLPVRFVGVGEGIDDLQPFDAEAFAKALI